MICKRFDRFIFHIILFFASQVNSYRIFWRFLFVFARSAQTHPPYNFTTSNFCPRIARRLCSKIIEGGMQNHRFANYLVQDKSVRQTRTKSISICPEQRRQISCMMRMRTILRIIVHPRIGKRGPYGLRFPFDAP